jgi:CRP/FNR family cyclic AMP-dependent transcriptional regulator
MSLLDSSGRPASVVTLEETTSLWLDRATFQGCLETMPVLAFNMMTILSSRLRRANEQIQALSTLNVRGRVARQILVLAQRYGQVDPTGDIHIPIRLTQSDLGSLVGASRERVNGVISDCKRRRELSVDSDHCIVIHDQAALVRTCCAALL